MAVFNYDRKKLDPRYKRLATEHEALHALCERSNKISYEITKQVATRFPPEAYLITYKVTSFVGIDEVSKMPLKGYEHKVRITYPPEFPNAGGEPICYAETTVWHPNIRFNGTHKGRICITAKALGSYFTLDELVLRIGEILQYKNYLAENIAPYPEDENVARWVREFAEPKNIINQARKIAVDNSDLLLPVSPENDPDNRAPMPKPKTGIIIKKPTSTPQPHPGIVIKKKS